jgi:hypothetical protein
MSDERSPDRHGSLASGGHIRPNALNVRDLPRPSTPPIPDNEIDAENSREAQTWSNLYEAASSVSG